MLGAAGAVIGGAAALGGFLKGAIGEARDAQKVGALTNAVIKSTGGVANVTAKQVDTLATSISNKTGVDDEAIASGENMLLTFGNVRNEVGKGNKIFNRATVAANDMAAAFGGDAVSNSKMLGKALNDPTKGVSALTRVGVSFTQQQKDQIKAMQASGDLLGAQKIILGEVSKQTAGAAESQATAGQKFKTAFANLEESVGTALLPLFDKLLNGMSKFVIFLTNDIGPGIAALNGFLAPAITSVKALFASFSGSGQASALGATFAKIGSAISTNFLPVLLIMANTFQTSVLPAITRLGSYLAANLLPIFARVGVIIGTQVVPVIARLAAFFYGQVYPAVVRIAVAIGTQLKPVFNQLFTTIQTKVLPTVSYLLAQFQRAQPTIQRVVMVVLRVVGALLVLAAAILGKVLPVVIRLAGFFIGLLAHALVFVIRVIARVVGNAITMGKAFVNALQGVKKFLDGVDRFMGKVVKIVGDVPGKVKNALGNLGGTLFHAGESLIQGLIDGIGSKINAAVQKVKDGLSKIKNLLPGSPIKEGPLKSWNNGGAGKRLVGLLADGLSETAPIDAAMARLTARVSVGAPSISAATAGAANGSLSSLVAAGVIKVHVVNPGDIAVATDGRADRRVAAHAGVSNESIRSRRR